MPRGVAVLPSYFSLLRWLRCLVWCKAEPATDRSSEVCTAAMAVQVTLQSKNHAEKIRKLTSVITGVHNKNVIFVLIYACGLTSMKIML